MSRTTTSARTPHVLCWAAAAGTVAATGVLLARYGIADIALALCLAILAASAGVLGDRISRVSTISLADLPTLAAMFMLRPGMAAAVAVIGGVACKGLRGMVSRALNVTLIALPVCLGGVLFHELLSIFQVASPWAAPLSWFLIALTSAGVASATHWILATVLISLISGQPMKHYFTDVVLPLAKTDPLTTLPAVILIQLTIMLPAEGKVLPLLLGGATVAGVWLFVRAFQQQVGAREVKDDFFRAIFVSLARLLEMKDPETAQHSAQVASYSREIAAAMGLSEEEQSRIHLAGLLHDVGKVGVPDHILNKPGRLSDSERRTMERHSRLSAEAIQNIPGFGDLTRMVYAHHERLDGSGYPEGVSGPDVPLGARIIGVADTFEALTSDRPYRDGRPPRVALSVIEDEIHLFDPAVVEALRRVVAAGKVAPRSKSVTDFAAEWSRAARYLDVNPDDTPFAVPAESDRPDKPDATRNDSLQVEKTADTSE